MDDILQDEMLGTFGREALLDLLVAKVEAGLHYPTLAILAREMGIRKSFDREVGRLNGAVIAVGKPAVLLLTE